MLMYRLMLGGLLSLTLCGCGSGPQDFTDNSKDPDAFARTIRQVTVDTVADAKTSREPQDELFMLADAVSGENKPLGEHADVYARLEQKATQLAEACEAADGPVPQLPQGLDELLALAEELPGESKSTEAPRY